MGEAKNAGALERRGEIDESDPGAYIGQDPATVRDAEDQRADGRPTGGDGPTGLKAPDGPASDHPTEAPEEHGELPTTEHAPGGDL